MTPSVQEAHHLEAVADILQGEPLLGAKEKRLGAAEVERLAG